MKLLSVFLIVIGLILAIVPMVYFQFVMMPKMTDTQEMKNKTLPFWFIAFFGMILLITGIFI